MGCEAVKPSINTRKGPWTEEVQTKSSAVFIPTKSFLTELPKTLHQAQILPVGLTIEIIHIFG